MNRPTKALLLFSDGTESGRISEWCTREVATIPLFKRAVLSACKAGIEEVVFWGCGLRDEIKGEFEQDPRITARIKWLDRGAGNPLGGLIKSVFAEGDGNPFFIIKSNVLFGYRLLFRLAEQSLDGSVAAAVPNTPGGSGVLLASGRIKDFLSDDGSGFSLEGLVECLGKEGLLNRVDVQGLLCEEVDSQRKLELAEKRLYRLLGTSCDSPILDKRVIRKVSGVMSKFIIRTAISPNQITFASLVLGLLTGLFFSFGDHTFNTIAVLFYFLSVIFDQSDGEVARLKHLESKSGHVLDIVCDTAVNVALVIGITCGVYRVIGSGYVIMLGLLAMVGISISLLLVTYFEERSNVGGSGRTSEVLDRLNNKDFFYIIIILCVIANQMIWFLLVMAVGTNVYWLMRKMAFRKLVYNRNL